MVAHWRNFLGVFVLAIILHSKCNLGQRIQNHKSLLCSDSRLYHEETKKCYVPFTKGPCGEQMVVKEFEGSGIGVCRCDIAEVNVNHCPVRPIVFLPKYRRCFSLYDQGPCKEGEWLAQIGFGEAAFKCEAIPCPERYKDQYRNNMDPRRSSVFVFGHNGQCYDTQSTNHDLCNSKYESGKKVYFTGQESNFYQWCGVGNECTSTSFPDNGCRNGAQPDIHGGCEPNTEFE